MINAGSMPGGREGGREGEGEGGGREGGRKGDLWLGSKRREAAAVSTINTCCSFRVLRG